MMKSLGIYIHSPFCSSKCGYCSFYSFPGSEEEKKLYLVRLEDEIISRIDNIKHEYQEATIYFGGGTPSYFPAISLGKLIQKVIKRLSKQSLIVREVTVEVNPADYDFCDFLHLLQSGVTRISIGVQSLIDDDLNVMGRRHSVNEALNTLGFAIKAGFEGVSADFIYGLPNQEFSQWQKKLEDLFQLGLNHISLYELTLEEGTPFYEKDIVNKSEESLLEFLDKMLIFFKKNGFERYEISNYSKGKSHRSLHNINYWRQNDYLGFGPSAVSTIASRRITVKPSLQNYLTGKIHYKVETLSEQELHFEKVMLGLRSSEGVSFEAIKSYQNNYLSKQQEEIAIKILLDFINEGYFHKREGNLSFTNKGFLLYNEIISNIL